MTNYHKSKNTNHLWLLLLLVLSGWRLSAQYSVCGDGPYSPAPQITYTGNLSTTGNFFDKIYDRYGNPYTLNDLAIGGNTLVSGSNRAAATASCQAGFFNVHFNAGSGMAGNTTIELQRQAVICQVLKDVSWFINPTLASTHATTVNILVDAFGTYTTSSNPMTNVLGFASPYYTFPANPQSSNPGIADNLVYKAITTQQNPLNGISPPLAGSNFFHGYMAFNFANPLITWHTNMGTLAGSSDLDLYTIALHEITHALGFASLIDIGGVSRFGTANNYFSRYDRFLQTQSGTPLLGVTNACSGGMLGTSFNAPASVVGAACTNNPPNTTTCGLAVKFVSPNVPNMPVYTPACYEGGSSLSHFEDMCFPIGSPAGNDLYFTMSNANGPGTNKRFYRPEERLALCNLGYPVNTSYTSAAVGGNTVYSGGCSSTLVYGINDGVGANNTFLYTSAGTVTIPITGVNGVMNNDSPNTSTIACVSPVYNSGAVSVVGNNIVYTPNANSYGIHLLQYVPKDASGNVGNATYIFAYIFNGSCSIASGCDLVSNGGFETGSLCGTYPGPIFTANVYADCWNKGTVSPDMFVRNCTSVVSSAGSANLGNSTYGSSPVFDSYNGPSNVGVMGMINLVSHPLSPFNLSESAFEQLTTPLQPGQAYQANLRLYNYQGNMLNLNGQVMNINTGSRPLLFTIGSSNSIIGFNNPEIYPDNQSINNGVFSVINTFTTTSQTNSWQNYAITFTYSPSNGLPGKYLYIGLDQGATRNMFPNSGTTTDYYYVLIDEVSIKPLSTIPTLVLPTVCNGPLTSYTNLAQYLSPVQSATFSGQGVTYSGGQYHFNTAYALTPGIYTITVDYVATNSCTGTFNQTVSVQPIPSFTLSANPAGYCPNAPMPTFTLSASPAGSYTWQPGGSVGNTAVVSSPGTYTATYTYSNGCVSSKTLGIGAFAIPTVSASIAGLPYYCSSPAAPTGTVNLLASGALSYTWQPGNITGSSVVAYPNSTTTYTVYGSNAAGCTGSATVTFTVFSSPVLNLSAGPNVTCAIGASTLNVSGATAYTWQPGNLNGSSIVVSPTVPTVYTVSGVSANGLCVAQGTLLVDPSPTVTAFVDGNPYRCLGQSSPGNTYLFGQGAVSYTWHPGNYTGNPFIVTPTVTTTYTVFGANSSGCTGSTSITYSVFNSPTISISAFPTGTCGTSPATLTASGGASYTWQPGNLSTNPIVVSPSVGTVYMVTGTSANGFCTGQASYSVNPLPCACVSSCSAALSGIISTNPASGVEYCVQADLYVQGYVVFNNIDLKISPNVSITVQPNSTLTILGSHLYACGPMWKGITLMAGARLDVFTETTKSTLIEDAFVAVDVLAYPPNYSMSNILNLSDVTFNRNDIGIRINGYAINQATYPYAIRNCLFTSRNIPFTVLNFPATNTVKLSASGNTGAMQTPYISNTAYPPLSLKTPLSGSYPNYGMVINDNGYSSVSQTQGIVYRGISIGAVGTTSFNCFDNLRTDIRATNSNLTVFNAVYQNGQRFGKHNASGGRGIEAISDNSQTAPGNNNNITVSSSTGNTLNTNVFYEKAVCVDVLGYLTTNISYARAYSSSNTYNQLNTPGAIGRTGFNVKTNRYYDIVMQGNQLYNIKNSMLVSLDNGLYNMNNGVSGNGRLVGRMQVYNNLVNRHTAGTNAAGEFVNVGLSISDPFTATTATFAPIVQTAITQNTFSNVHNGIAMSNMGYTLSNVSLNRVGLVNEPNTFVALPVQDGINVTQLSNASVTSNSITGPATYTTDMSGIRSSMNSSLAVRCNTTQNTYHGINFNASQMLSVVDDNVLQAHKYGISLTNTASIGQQGNSTYPTNNQWLGSWSATNYKTMNQNVYSSAQNSKVYVTWGGALDPTGSGTVIGAPGNMGVDEYFHLPLANPINNLLNATGITPSCRLTSGGGSGGGGGTGGAGALMLTTTNLSSAPASTSPTLNTVQKSGLEKMVSGSGLNPNISADTRFVDKHRVFRTLQNNPNFSTGSAVLSTFYSSALSSCMQQFSGIEQAVLSGNLTQAQSKVQAFSPGSAVEDNYKTFYNLYLKTKTANFKGMDSTALYSLANQCPYSGGGVVYQARALYNAVYNTYQKFSDNCNVALGSRLFDNVVKPEEVKEINVVLQSKLFPNPNPGTFTIELSTKTDELTEVLVYDINGKLVLTKSFKGQTQLQLTTDLAKGTYLVKVMQSNKTFDVHRLVIE